MSIDLALADAATNCARENAVATVTLKSGVQFRGRLKQHTGADLGTRHIETDSGGWVTFLMEEVAAVGAEHR